MLRAKFFWRNLDNECFVSVMHFEIEPHQLPFAGIQYGIEATHEIGPSGEVRRPARVLGGEKVGWIVPFAVVRK
jgi:hypothetical protein